MKNIKLRLILFNFLEFAVWGAYLTSMGRYLATHGMAGHIGWFYSIQGVVSLFMPAIMGIVADRWMEAQKVHSLCHMLAGVFMIAAGWYALGAGDAVQFGTLFTLYTISVAFFMPTIALHLARRDLHHLDHSPHRYPSRCRVLRCRSVVCRYHSWIVCCSVLGYWQTGNTDFLRWRYDRRCREPKDSSHSTG